MVYPYVETPRTEVDGNATYLTNGLRSVGRGNLSALDSVENSFQTPYKDENILKPIGGGRRRSSADFKLNTPRASTESGLKHTRDALNDLRQPPNAGPREREFTPLMKSAVKNSTLKNMLTGRGTKDPKTPAYLRASYRSNGNTPGLPLMEVTEIYEEDATEDQATPLPQVASSSAQSTPLPTLLGRNGGALSDGKNMMTLKEQEKVIDKLDKDNFGLKLKIHHLEDQLAKLGPTYNKAALKENAELKVTTLTMQRDIARYRKSLQQAERDLESYRIQFQDLREKAIRRQADGELQREIDSMREQINQKNARLKDLQSELRGGTEEVEKLRDELEDLEASVRERDRAIEERDDIIEELKNKGNDGNSAISSLETELHHAREQLRELQESFDNTRSDLENSKKAKSLAVAEKERAEEELKELHNEMANKSLNTKGLSRHLEEKVSRLGEELRELRLENSTLKQELESKSQRETRFEEQYQATRRGFEDEKRSILEKVEVANRERDAVLKEQNKVSKQLKEAFDEIKRKEEEKVLLLARHNALTDESAGLQNDLEKAHATVQELEQAVDDEKQLASHNVQTVRAQYRDEVQQLEETIDSLRHEIEDKKRQYCRDREQWEDTNRSLKLEKERAEEDVSGFRRTIEKLQQAEHSLSGKESKLQEAIDSEKTRHLDSEKILKCQIKELNDDLAAKRHLIDEQRGELLSVKEELRITRREREDLKESVQALEDEVAALQSSLEDEQKYTRTRLQKDEPGQENLLQRVTAEKQKLRDELASAHIELRDLRNTITEIEAERDELQAQLDHVQVEVRSRDRLDREKAELRKSTLRLESELKRLKDDRPSDEEREALEKQLSTEIERATMEENRLLCEIDRLQSQLRLASSDRDREISTARAKVQRLEKHIRDLEDHLEQQRLAEGDPSATNVDYSVLRHSLDEARKREKILRQREASQKEAIRSYKTRIVETEKELHEALMKKYETQSPQSSPSDKLHDELLQLRKQLSSAHKTAKELRSKNRELERVAMREEDRRELHDMLKSSALEAESLALDVASKEAQINELQTQIHQVREERASFAKVAESANRKLEVLRDRYNQALDKISAKPDDKGNKNEKEMMGLGKEITWLRARLKREEKFRRDLAWSKGLMELGEQVRIACNEADLRMITDMGVPRPQCPSARPPLQKLQTAISLVRATVRMQRMSREWRKAKKLGESLKRAKAEVLKNRENSSKKPTKQYTS